MAQHLQTYPTKPRTFILTDITNEPDDAQSFCRYLTYSNQFDTEGIVPVTSTWLRNKVAPEALHDILDGYADVVHNLNTHTHPSNPYPSADHLRNLVRSGAPVYGMEAVGDDIPLSAGAQLLLERLLADDERPLWVLVWGGTNVLASVLYRIRRRSDAALVRSKIRIYTTSDQDDTGAWIRQNWPGLFYICSVHGWNQYFGATWTGISGGLHPEDRTGADRTMLAPEWIKDNFQIGPLGQKYPDVMYAMEGDSPTFLYLVQNGLGDPEEPSWGSWGGRYTSVNPMGEAKSSRGHFSDCIDMVTGKDGESYFSCRATIWRWRTSFQQDFAARMQWTLTSDFSKVNHAPVVDLDGAAGLGPVRLDVDAGSTIRFNASKSYDPDGDDLHFKWWQYKEPSAIQSGHPWEVINIDIKPFDQGRQVEVSIPPAEISCAVFRSNPPTTSEKGSPLHMILEVTDNGVPALRSYRRIIMTPVRTHGVQAQDSTT
ncbi:hypothetical protein C7974DRAFT_117154 [Boeremia exigua]|uniref:uncharacterized protein n=1 Tax=Boeremia exigua TaxID=749465 RepID=UPI001E8DE4A5|nr:uncharacterized protein C7974DRAFT_117154 [Boeremia exigua]KAH6643102.1 hypothetical protein C7974DRAFT_117154 [Boeremia exigua]